MDLLKNFYGLPGLFIACVYSAALRYFLHLNYIHTVKQNMWDDFILHSTVSSGLNSLTAVFLHDFIYPLNAHLNRRPISDHMSLHLSKLLSCVFGLVVIGLSFLCEYAGSTVLQISLSIFGLLGGPLLGVISLGMFVTFANSTVWTLVFVAYWF